MEIKFIKNGRQKLAILENPGFKINSAQDALELLMNCQYSGTNKVIISRENLIPGFFDLKTGIAGEILQKFSTYDGFLAIIGDHSQFGSKSLKDFIFESNKMRRINFVASQEDAIIALSR